MAYPGGWRKENSPVKNFLTTGADLLALRLEKRRRKSVTNQMTAASLCLENTYEPERTQGSTTREAIKKPLIRSGFFINGVPGGLEERKFSGEEFSDDRCRFVSFEARKSATEKALQIK